MSNFSFVLRWLDVAWRHRALTFGAMLLGALLLLALTAPWLFPGDPHDMVGAPALAPGGDPEFLLGTDLLGRDVAAGLAWGTRVSLFVGLASAAIAIVIGSVVGVLAGYARGWTDTLLMRVCELFQTIPHFLFAIFIVAILGATVRNITLAIGLTFWTAIARLVRAETLLLREMDFVRVAPSMGVSDLRIILTHVLPNAMPPVIANASILAAIAILSESGLSFLGLGDPNSVSWGGMIGAGREAIRSAWYLTIIPGAAVLVAVLSLNLIGDGLIRALDPRSRA
jgi:peptide/nickel transport system permease protein